MKGHRRGKNVPLGLILAEQSSCRPGDFQWGLLGHLNEPGTFKLITSDTRLSANNY
jgi:hypothetical protein